MHYDPATLSVPEMYSLMVDLITPRPIAWVSTCSPDGRTNLAPFSFFNGVSANPPALLFCPSNRRDGSKKDTLVNIEATGEFVVNVVSFALSERMNQCSAEYDAEVSEFGACGLTPADAQLVGPPRVAEALAHMECKLHEIIHLGTGPAGGNIVIGRIVICHVADEVLRPDGRIDPARLDTVGRLGGRGYSRTTDRFDLARPTVR